MNSDDDGHSQRDAYYPIKKMVNVVLGAVAMFVLLYPVLVLDLFAFWAVLDLRLFTTPTISVAFWVIFLLIELLSLVWLTCRLTRSHPFRRIGAFGSLMVMIGYAIFIFLTQPLYI